MVINDPEILASVTRAFEAYERALMDNDLDALAALFWESPHTVRYGVGEMLYGYAQIAAFRAGRVGGSPQRRLLARVITSFGDAFATASVEFLRDGAERVGRQSQSWACIDGAWRVVAAHVSMVGEGS